MNIPCCTPPSLCQDPADAIGNFSSEAPDVQRCYGRNYGAGLIPPLGSDWTVAECIGDCTVELTEAQVLAGNTCSSTLTTFQTEECSWNAAVECRNDNNDGTNGGGALFVNDEQSCSYTCPDGNVFTYTVPRGTFLGLSLAMANNIAYSTACNRAIALRICISDLTPDTADVGVLYSGTVEFTGPVGDYTSSIVSGTLPPGIGYIQDEQTGVFSGIPTESGDFDFTIRVEDADGNFMDKALSITVEAVIVPPDPFFYYALESNPSGTTILDSVAGRNMALSFGAAPSSVIPAKIGNGFEFSAQPAISIHRRDNADCAIQGLDVTMRFWVYFSTADIFEVHLQIIQGSSWFILSASNDGGFNPEALLQIRRNAGGGDNQVSIALPMNQWNHLICWHEEGVGVGLRVNNGTPSTLAFVSGIQQTNSLRLNADTNSGGTFRIDEIAVWKGQVLTTAEQDADWNDGNGITWPW